MFKQAVLALAMMSAIVSSIATPAFAADNLYLGSHMGAQQDVRVGFYLKVPLGGDVRKSHALKPKFGLAMDYTREYSNSTLMMAPKNRFRASLLDLSFSSDRDVRFAVLGTDTNRFGGLYAGGEKEGMGTATKILIGVGVTAVVLVGGLMIAAATDECLFSGCT